MKRNFERVFSVPTRDWNTPIFSHSHNPRMFLAYLRGIETRLAIRIDHTIHVFSVPTRDWNPSRWIRLNSGRYPFLAYLRGIETCPSRSALDHMPCVFSVPTRDWNTLVRPLTTALAWFLAYLRGIETRIESKVRGNGFKFLAYLRGIETWPRGGYGWRSWWRFLAYLRGIETKLNILVV